MNFRNFIEGIVVGNFIFEKIYVVITKRLSITLSVNFVFQNMYVYITDRKSVSNRNLF